MGVQSDSGDRSRGGESEESAMRDDVVGEISLELKRGRGQGPSYLFCLGSSSRLSIQT